jgi:DNA-binding transcriptional LysR family regulator
MDWDDIRVFMEIAEGRSLTVAARHTGLSQPTISRRLKSMEDAVGGALFERFPNRIELTALGRELIEPALGMKTGAESVRRKAELFVQGRPQIIRVSTTMSVSQFLCQHLGRLSRSAADQGGELHIEPTREALNFAFRQTDLAIRLRGYPEHGPAKVRRIGRVSTAVYGRRDTAAARRGVIGLTSNRPPPQPEWLDRYAASQNIAVVARLGEFFQRYAAVKGGLGISLLPCFLGDADGELERLGEVPRELDEDAYLLFHPDMSDLPAVRVVADGITELFATHRPLLCGEAQAVQPPA